jgi:hypothetical protein
MFTELDRVTESIEESTRERIERIFDEALDRPLAARADYLVGTCGDDPELRAEVEAMLDHYASTHGALLSELASHELCAPKQAGAPPRIGSAEVLEGLPADGPLVRWSTRRSEAPREGILVLARGQLTGDARRRLTYRAESLLRAEHPALSRVIEMGSVEAGRGTEVFMVHENVGGVVPHAEGADSIAELRRSVQRLVELCEGLDELHRRGVFHGRVSRSIRLVEDDTLRLAEPGFAGLLAVLPPDGSEMAPLPGPTDPAPEWSALPGWELDGRVDVHAVGALLKCVCGSLEGPLARHTGALADHCLAADRNERPRSGGVLADALRSLIQTDQVDDLDYSPKASMTTIILCVVAGVAGFALGALLI